MTQSAQKGLTFIVTLMIASAAWTQDGSENGILSHEVMDHIGELAMVCGVVVGLREERQPVLVVFRHSYPNYSPITEHTILYFDKLPPHHEFMVGVEDANRRAFPDKLGSYVDQKACVYGKILKYGEHRAIMALVRADQIAVEDTE